MRLLVLHELGIPEVEISIVKPKTEAEKVEYSLSDNDRAGEYDDQALAEKQPWIFDFTKMKPRPGYNK